MLIEEPAFLVSTVHVEIVGNFSFFVFGAPVLPHLGDTGRFLSAGLAFTSSDLGFIKHAEGFLNGRVSEDRLVFQISAG